VPDTGARGSSEWFSRDDWSSALMADRSTGTHRRAAVFVDFENVYIGLCKSSKEAGWRFATQPARWISWMENELGPFLVDIEDQPRTLLRRICYLDPARSSRFRPYFTRAGFRVVDCPALTAMGKNSADIYMVLDILDTLTHPTWFDEFIVLSVDADFTPVLLRLREHDRRTAMLVSGPAAAAMQAACDFAIPDAMFLDEALGLDERDAEAADPVEVVEVVEPEVVVGEVEAESLHRRMETVVRELVAAASEPVVMAKAAHDVRTTIGAEVDTTRWAGNGTFGRFAAKLTGERLRMDTTRPPGWLYDPARHAPPHQEPEAGAPAGVPEVAERVNRIVGAPLLTRESYESLFDVLATDARLVSDKGQTEAERVARDVCGARGAPVSRATVHFVLVGYRYSGFDWTDPALDGAALAGAFVDNVLRLAADAQMDLTEAEQAEVRTWILGD
jgi:NYN domain-containing protein